MPELSHKEACKSAYGTLWQVRLFLAGLHPGVVVPDGLAYEVDRSWEMCREATGNPWIACKDRMPDGWERLVFVWVVWPDSGRYGTDLAEATAAWWKHGPECFGYQDVQNANHLVTHWMEIPVIEDGEVSP